MDDKDEKPKNLGEQISASSSSYSSNSPVNSPVISGDGMPDKKDEANSKKAEFEKIKSKLEELKKKILKNYKFTKVLGIIPGNAVKIFEEDEGIPKEVSDTKPIHLIMIIPEEKYKEIPKIKTEVIKMIKETKENLWIHIKTEVDLWNYGLDSKFEFIDVISSIFPLHDSGFLGALRVANIHKTLVLRKFEKYVATYAIGGSLVRGTAEKSSDVDTFVIIDDTDVKRMPRLQLLDKLRGIIYDYIREATALAGVKNVLNVQVYLLTDFWQSVKDATPIMFTFIRDGIPLYDRGTFIPWKLLLKMGKIKPSPEAIDSYMKQGDQTESFVKRRLMDSMIDIYFGVVTPTQALMMLAGEAPPVPKTIVSDVRKVLVEREKVMKASDLKTLEKAVGFYKDYEHGKLKKISGAEIDELLKDGLNYQKVLKELRKKLEVRMSQKTAEEIYDEVFKILKSILGNKSQDELVRAFESSLVKKGKIQPRFIHVLNELVSIKRKLKSGKLNPKETDKAKKDSIELVNALVEYSQRAELVKDNKGVLMISYDGGKKKAELVLLEGKNFLIKSGGVYRFSGGKLVKSDKKELEKSFEENKGKLGSKASGKIFENLKKEIGDFEIVF